MKKTTILTFISILSINAYSEFDHDKAINFGVSYAIGKGFNNYVFNDYRESYVSCLGLGLTKEFYDEISHNNYSHNDMALNFLGCGAGIWISEYFKNDIVNIDIEDEGFMISLKYYF